MSDNEGDDEDQEKVIELKTTKKPKKKMSEENLAKLALARIKAGEAKRANMEIRHLQKENNKLEKQEEVAKIKEKNAKLKAPKEPKIEPVKEQDKKVEKVEPNTDTEDEPEVIRKVVKKKKKKQVIIVQSSTDDESEDEKVIYVKKPKKKKEVIYREPTPEELQVLINQEKAKTEPIPTPTREEAITEIRKQQSGMFNNPFHNKRYGRAF